MRALALVLLAAASPAGAFGRGAKGTSAAAFLKLPDGARPAALGGAVAALADDAHAAAYDPAGLAWLVSVEAAATHGALFQDLRHDFGVIAVPLLSLVETRRPRNALGVAALSVTSLGADGIPRRGPVETDEPTGSFGAADYAYALSYAKAVDGRLALGGTVALVEQSLDSARARAVSTDAGALWRGERVALGAGWRRLGGRMRLGSSADPLPSAFYAAGALRPFPGAALALEVRAPRDDAQRLSVGAELERSFGGLTAALRGGYDAGRADADGLGGVSLGGGVGWGRFGADFAWVPFGDLGTAYLTTIRLRF